MVIGNPCADPDKVPTQAPEIGCTNGELDGATKSDHGYIIIGMLHTGSEATKPAFAEAELTAECAERRAAGYRSGMGTIFREVALISEIVVGETASSTARGLLATASATGTVTGSMAAAKTNGDSIATASDTRATGTGTAAVATELESPVDKEDTEEPGNQMRTGISANSDSATADAAVQTASGIGALLAVVAAIVGDYALLRYL